MHACTHPRMHARHHSPVRKRVCCCTGAWVHVHAGYAVLSVLVLVQVLCYAVLCRAVLCRAVL